MIYILCVIFSVSLAVGQLLFKLSANQIGKTFPTDGILSILSPYLLSALALYGATTVLWVYILTKLPLSIAYPFSLAGAAIVIGLSAIVLGESISTKQLLGMVIIFFGLLIIYV